MLILQQKQVGKENICACLGYFLLHPHLLSIFVHRWIEADVNLSNRIVLQSWNWLLLVFAEFLCMNNMQKEGNEQ